MTDGYKRAQAAYDAAEPDDATSVACPRCGGSGGVACEDESGTFEAECGRCGGSGASDGQ
jgi:DnaJ-class molecular chaperone